VREPFRSRALEALAADPEALRRAARAAGLSPANRRALAREELRLLDSLGRGASYQSLRAFLEALARGD
jgi:hypothetical protein